MINRVLSPVRAIHGRIASQTIWCALRMHWSSNPVPNLASAFCRSTAPTSSLSPFSTSNAAPALYYNQVCSNDSQQSIEGGGEPVIVLHGLFGSAQNWGTVGKKICETGGTDEVYLVDLRNHGKSFHDDRMDVASMVEDVRRLQTEVLGISKASYIGHSMGGKVLMNLAAQHPALLSKMVVVDIAPVPYNNIGGFSNYIGALRRIDVANAKSRRVISSLLEDEIKDERIRQFLLTNLIPQNGGFRWRMNLDAIERFLPDIRRCPLYEHEGPLQPEVPALFLAGSRSDYVKREDHSVIKRLFPHSQIEYLDGGHWLHFDCMDSFVEAINRFLR